MNQKPMIILAGPTAAGKSDLSLRLARAVGGEILSADSMQVYRGMDIGTAKLLPGQRQGIAHYLIDEIMPDQPFHVVTFQKMAKEALKIIYQKGRIPVVTGGTGFYIQALLKDVDFTENDKDPSYRHSLEEIARTGGGKQLHDMLCRVDPVAAQAIHPNNVKKVIRALEFYHQTGGEISAHNAAQSVKSSPYRYAYFVLTMDRQALYERIDRRVDDMIAAGLVREVEQLREKGYGRDLVSMQGLGYKELYAWLDGECSLEEAVDRIKTGTRHFAKRQLTWFRREKDAVWIDRSDFSSEEEILNYILRIIDEKGIVPARESL